ncbi:hypothetical protein P153DRAFT_205752 [Dothidotthia symphoricarpi CBS 119687]|uniref:Uncharacterized protein n=1 Tax=Dothidotthia symphoricarpi CBS 119687 TaxID=1392245 RepID=A0A6A6AGD0_9PLEO|nr:uncharacterized protein P153DRAFT_205752 [Dothidotthia symphoricarpi CBS 119687]KAF2130840.1 hypothetical protein P153DRAFT_205752 [Dothidotthia symphoricarpi CBS 119687]
MIYGTHIFRAATPLVSTTENRVAEETTTAMANVEVGVGVVLDHRRHHHVLTHHTLGRCRETHMAGLFAILGVPFLLPCVRMGGTHRCSIRRRPNGLGQNLLKPVVLRCTYR